jgi:hypothetical protein
MNMGVHEIPAEHIGERRLWTAILLQALEDWRSSSARRQMEAERFFFECPKDFGTVCSSAGLDPDSVLDQLQKMQRGQ